MSFSSFILFFLSFFFSSTPFSLLLPSSLFLPHASFVTPSLPPSIAGLPTTKLALYLEDRINHFLQAEEVDAGTVTIRVVFSSDKVLDTHALMKNRFQRSFPESFPYRTKAIVAFQEIDGADVCFFGIHVQEYGSDCQAPNTR